MAGTGPPSARFTIRVKPGAKSHGVGGTWGDERALNVSVQEKAIDGKANRAALELLATVLGVNKRQLQIVSGATHRTKLVEVVDPPDDLGDRLEHWRQRN